jgi:hypothetical protein
VSYGAISHICPKNTIDAILKKWGKASLRIRLFPATAVVYFVILMNLWREYPLEEVIKLLVEDINYYNMDTAIKPPTKGAISTARKRLGADVLRELSYEVLKPIAPVTLNEAWYKGLRLMAVDGTCFTLPDDPKNAEFYGYPGLSRGEAAFPKAKVLALVETGTHATIMAKIAPYKVSEQALFCDIIDSGKLEKNMLLLADRGFYGYRLWLKAVSTGACMLWRTRLDLQFPVEEKLPDGSYLSTVYDSKNRKACEPVGIRVIQYKLRDLNIHSEDEDNRVYRLITNIFDYKNSPANELAALYHERWEIESLYKEFKVHLGYNSIIRSQSPILVEQELWGIIIMHYILRKMALWASWNKRLDPDKISFKNSIYVLRRKLPHVAAFPPNGAVGLEKEDDGMDK